jgi:outer membrane protein TolC
VSPLWALAEETAPTTSSSYDLTGIDVLDLTTAMRIALEDSPTLKAALERVNQATQRIHQATAAYWPTLDLTGSANRVKLSDSYAFNPSSAQTPSINPAASITNPDTYYDSGLAASWILFDGFRRKFSIAFAQYGEQQSEAALMEARRLLLAATAESFHLAQLAREDYMIAVASEEFNLEQLKNANARYRVGTGALSDKLNFEIQVNNAKAERIDTRRAYRVAIIGLASIMGIPEATLPEEMELARLKEEPAAYMQRPQADGEVAYAMIHRPDVLRGEYAIKQAETSVRQVQSRFYPAIDIAGRVDGQRTGDIGFESTDFGNSIGVFLRWNLFAGGEDWARVKEQKGAVAESERNLDTLKISVASEIQEALAQLIAAQDQLELQRINAALVQQNRDLVEKEYNSGQGSLVRVNEAQRDLIQAQSRLALARVSLRHAWVNLEAATGRILTRYSDGTFGVYGETAVGE